MAGLLDAMNDPLMGFAMGLLNASGPSRVPISMGQAIGQGYQGYQEAQQAAQHRQMLEQQMRAQQLQQQQAQMQLAEMQRKQQQEIQTDQALRDAYLSPQQQAIAAGGPTNAAASLIPSLKPKFDEQAALNNLYVANPRLALAMRHEFTKQPIKLGAEETLLDPTTYKPIASGMGKSDVKEGYLVKGADGKWAIDPALYEAAMGVKRAGATKVNVPVSLSTEKKYGEQFAGKVADSDVAMMDAAQRAPDLADRSNRIKQVLKGGKVITGYGADFRLQFAKAAGLVGASDSETIANTEALSADLARNTLDAIKASGLGSGSGFSNADRDFLNKAAGGLLTFDQNTISRLADLSHKAATQTATKWNQRVKAIPDSAIAGTGVSRAPVEVPPLFDANGKQSAMSSGGWSASVIK